MTTTEQPKTTSNEKSHLASKTEKNPIMNHSEYMNYLKEKNDFTIPTLEECQDQIILMNQSRSLIHLIDVQMTRLYKVQSELTYKPYPNGSNEDPYNTIYWLSGSEDDRAYLLHQYYQDKKLYYEIDRQIQDLAHKNRIERENFKVLFEHVLPPACNQSQEALADLRKQLEKNQCSNDIVQEMIKEGMTEIEKEEKKIEKDDGRKKLGKLTFARYEIERKYENTK